MTTLDVLKALADSTRLRILNLLLASDELCACEIEAVLDLNQSNASRHLTRLRQVGLLTAERRGHWVHFAIAPSHGQPDDLVARAVASARADGSIPAGDLDRLRAYRVSGYSCATIDRWSAEMAGSES